MRENLYLNHVVPECQKMNKVNKERDNRKHQSQGKNTQANCVYSSLLEGKRHQSLARPDKIEFLNEPKQTGLAKQNQGVNMMHTDICVTLTCYLPHHGQTALLYFF